jgi:hypothetical protein
MNRQTLQEKELRQRLRSVFGKSIYSDDVIEVIVNCQLNKWTDADIDAYHKARQEEFEQLKMEFGDTLPLEEQIIHNPAVFYHDNVNGNNTTKSESIEIRTPEN